MKRSRCPTSRLPSSARSLTIASTIRTAPPRRFRSLWRAPTWFLSRNRRERWRGRTYRSFAFCSWIIQYNNLIPPCLKFVLAKTSISFHFFFWVLSFEMQPHDLLYPFANLASYGGHLSHWLMGETKVECGVSEWDNEYVPSVCNDNHLKSASKPWTWSKRTKGNLHSILKRCRSWNFLSSIVHNSKMLIFWGEHWARGLICFVFFFCIFWKHAMDSTREIVEEVWYEGLVPFVHYLEGFCARILWEEPPHKRTTLSTA